MGERLVCLPEHPPDLHDHSEERQPPSGVHGCCGFGRGAPGGDHGREGDGDDLPGSLHARWSARPGEEGVCIRRLQPLRGLQEGGTANHVDASGGTRPAGCVWLAERSEVPRGTIECMALLIISCCSHFYFVTSVRNRCRDSVPAIMRCHTPLLGWRRGGGPMCLCRSLLF